MTPVFQVSRRFTLILPLFHKLCFSYGFQLLSRNLNVFVWKLYVIYCLHFYCYLKYMDLREAAMKTCLVYFVHSF